MLRVNLTESELKMILASLELTISDLGIIDHEEEAKEVTELIKKLKSVQNAVKELKK